MPNNAKPLTLDLLWSLWTELGVPGHERRHGGVVIDPEPLVIYSPWLVKDDPRLRDEIFRWCASNAPRLSASRLAGLLKGAPPHIQGAFFSMSETLFLFHNIRWPRAKGAEPWPRAPVLKASIVQPIRPALLCFRLRGIAGVGARADILGALIAQGSQWRTAADLQGLGYSKRNIARILTELSETGQLRSKAKRNALAYRLESPRIWSELVSGQGLSWPDWPMVLRFMEEIHLLAEAESQPPRLRRLKASKSRPRFVMVSDELSLSRPPGGRGNPDIWENLMSWSQSELSPLTRGIFPS